MNEYGENVKGRKICKLTEYLYLDAPQCIPDKRKPVANLNSGSLFDYEQKE